MNAVYGSSFSKNMKQLIHIAYLYTFLFYNIIRKVCLVSELFIFMNTVQQLEFTLDVKCQNVKILFLR
jgi:hypothetical protein